MLNIDQRNYIVKLLQSGESIPEDLKYLLFPTQQKEYELVYCGKMRKVDLLANEDGVQPVPLQVEKIFNGNDYEKFEDGWKNMIVFGDNLQFLKTINENKDDYIKDKIKGKVKLIYIDPPFGTGDKYEGNKGQSSYTAKRNNSDFIEFIRRRLIIAREILSDDGIIFVRQGYNFGHYIRVVLDEVFGRNNFINEIVVNRGKQRLGGSKKYSTATDTIYLYSKTENYNFNQFKRERYTSEAKGTNMLMKGHRNPPERIFLDPAGKKVVLLPPDNQHWKFVQEKINEMYRKKVIYLATSKKGLDSGICKLQNGKKIPVDYVPSFTFDDDKTVDSNWTDISGYTQSTGYPTENSEDLLYRVISTGTNEGDIVLDFFGGSGTTMAVSEKIGRKWIVCDIGKLSYFTMQKRILKIQDSKDLINPKNKYNKRARSFMTCTLGLYDLQKTFDLEWNKYLDFIASLFEIELTPKFINGYKFDGKKDNFFVKVWDYNTYKDSKVDINFISDIHKTVGARLNGRVYIVAPINSVDFMTEYHEIDGLRYYFLKIPYQVIKELHKTPFQKLRQPQSKNNVNDLDDTIGFHFIRQPEVKTEIKDLNDKIQIVIKEFKSQYHKDEEGKILGNFETFSAVFIDQNFDGKQFIMTKSYFADELLKIEFKDEENLRDNLVKVKSLGLVITLEKKEIGKRVMLVYTDIYGNDFVEEFTI